MIRLMLLTILPLNEAGGFVPPWVWDPKEKIIDVVINWILDGIESGLIWVGEIMESVYEGVVETPLIDIGSGLMDALRDTGNGLLDAERAITDMMINLGLESGFAAPLSAIIMVVLLALMIAVVTGVMVLLVRVVSPV